MKAKWRIAALIACCFAGVVMASQPPAPTPIKPARENQYKTTPEESKAVSKQQPPRPESSGVEKDRRSLTTKHQEEFRSDRSNEPPRDWWAIIAGALNLLFTGCLVVLMYRQWRAMQEQARYMKDGLTETMKAADAAAVGAAAAKVSAEAAKASAKATGGSLDLAFRAYIFCEVVGDPFEVEGGDSKVEIIVKNYGGGPARDVMSTAHADAVNDAEEFVFDETAEDGDRAGLLAPKQRFSFEILIPRELSPKLGPGTRLVIGGVLRYSDFSGERRTTHWCQRRVSYGWEPILSLYKYT